MLAVGEAQGEFSSLPDELVIKIAEFSDTKILGFLPLLPKTAGRLERIRLIRASME